MDAVEFIKELNRMCNSACAVDIELQGEVEEQVRIVEEWSAAHPRKTRQSVFLEQWPSARIDKDIDVLNICPADLDERYRDIRGRCNIQSTQTGTCDCCRRAFWMQEVE